MAGIHRKNIELIRAGKRRERKHGKRVWHVAGASVFPVIVLCCYLVPAYEYCREGEAYQAETGRIESFLQSGEAEDRRERVTGLLESANLLAEYEKTMEKAVAALELVDPPGTREMGILLKAREGNVQVKEVSYAKGQLSFVGITESYKEISFFIRRLKNSNLTKSLTYAGFAANDEGRYEFRVTLSMKE